MECYCTVQHPLVLFSVSAHREFVAQRWTSAAVAASSSSGSSSASLANPRLFFSACSGDQIVDLSELGETATFEICQAGYADRKLIYDSRLE